MITVIGAANVDITASPLGQYVPCDSNPSRVEIAFGGVGRNIAHNLCLLGADVRFFTAFGDDNIALTLRDDCRRLGMTIDPIIEIAGARSNYFICVNDHNGEMQAGAADMELMSHLTPEMVAAHIVSINDSDAVVADCNVSEAVLKYLLQNCTTPLYIDATSSAKAMMIKALFGVEHAMPLIVKVNKAEAEVLTGLKGDIEAMARWFIERGIDRVYITLGAEGALVHDKTCGVTLPAQAVKVINATGAGDAFMAAVVNAELQGASIAEACASGISAAAIVLQSKTAVNDNIANL